MQLLQNISDIMSLLDRHPRRCKWGMVVFAFVYYLLISLQGLDYADEGFSLTFYQNIFTHPADVEYLFLYYLTGLIGGVWEILFGWLGTYGYRILFALTSCGIVLTTFAILRPYFKPSVIVLSTLACVLWPGLCLYYFNHDCLTILLFLLTILAMQRGLGGNKVAWYLMGGLIVLNGMVRLPNFALAILFFVPFVEAAYRENYYNAFHNALRILGGVIIASGVMLVVMLALQHLSVWFSSIGSLFVMSGDSSDTHNLQRLVGSYTYTYKAIVTSSLYVFLVYLIYIVATQYVKLRGNKLIAGAICVAILYALLTRNIYAMWGAVTAASLIYAFCNRSDCNVMIMALSALVMLVVIPIGGDSYNNISNSCMWLGMPLLIDLMRRPLKLKITIDDAREQRYGITIDESTSRDINLIAGVAFIFFVATHSVCYFDDGSRLEKLYRPQVATVATTYTSHQRAQLTDCIVTATLKHRMPGNYLLIFDNAPMLHYLTGMQPYLGSPWSTFWGADMFQRQLYDAEHSPRQLPLIAIPHFYYRDLSHTDYLNAIEHPELHAKANALIEFMQRHGYYEAYSDAYITLYKVPQ